MKRCFTCIFFICAAAVSALGWIRGGQAAVGNERQEDVLRIVAYNVGVFSKYQASSMQEVADMMHEIGADAIALCELDSCNRRHADFQLKDFCSLMGNGWDFRYGSAMQWNGGSYGIGAMTSRPVTGSFKIELPKGEGHEPRACVVVETSDYVLAAVHLDHKNEQVRSAQARIVTDELKARYARSRKPVFLCGDFNAKPDSQTLALLLEDWNVLSKDAPTYPSKESRICIDYVLALKNRARYLVQKTDVCTEFESADVREASDHLPVFVDVKIR